MIRKLIVPLDGSAVAERAIGLAEGLAIVADVPVVLFTARWDIDSDNANRYLAAQAATIPERQVERRVVLEQSAPFAIARELELTPDSMVVMSTHGRSGVGQALLGSVTEEVLRASTAPVLVIGPHWSGAQIIKGSSVLMAIDSEVSVSALLQPVIELARLFRLHVWIVQVLSSESKSDVPVVEETAAVHQVAKRLHEADVLADWEVLNGGDPADEILNFAESHDVSVLALTTRVRQGVKRVTLGSVAMRVVRHAGQPVLLARAAPSYY